MVLQDALLEALHRLATDRGNGLCLQCPSAKSGCKSGWPNAKTHVARRGAHLAGSGADRKQSGQRTPQYIVCPGLGRRQGRLGVHIQDALKQLACVELPTTVILGPMHLHATQELFETACAREAWSGSSVDARCLRRCLPESVEGAEPAMQTLRAGGCVIAIHEKLLHTTTVHEQLHHCRSEASVPQVFQIRRVRCWKIEWLLHAPWQHCQSALLPTSLELSTLRQKLGADVSAASQPGLRRNRRLWT